MTEQAAFKTPVLPLPNASAANQFRAFIELTISLCWPKFFTPDLKRTYGNNLGSLWEQHFAITYVSLHYLIFSWWWAGGCLGSRGRKKSILLEQHFADRISDVLKVAAKGNCVAHDMRKVGEVCPVHKALASRASKKKHTWLCWVAWLWHERRTWLWPWRALRGNIITQRTMLRKSVPHHAGSVSHRPDSHCAGREQPIKKKTPNVLTLANTFYHMPRGIFFLCSSSSRLSYFWACLIRSPSWHDGVGAGLSSGCTQDGTGCISTILPSNIQKVLRLTGVPGIPLTFGATLPTSLHSTFRTMTLMWDWEYREQQIWQRI